MKLFCYGTLKRGKSAHHLLDGCTFLGEASLEDYSLLGTSPAIVPNPGGWVDGELYMINDPETLKRVDRYEGYTGNISGNLYNRINVDVSHQVVMAYVYNHPSTYDVSELRNGEW